MADMPQTRSFSVSEATRFWAKVDRSGDDDACWPWTGAVNPHGYGKFSAGPHGTDRHWRSHRVAMLLTGSDPGAVTLHLCDNPPCCNPAHLRAGTLQDNQNDSARKGRDSTVLNSDLVRQIRSVRATGLGPCRIAKLLNVSQSAVSGVIYGHNWRHVE
jgi:hypothetical protein